MPSEVAHISLKKTQAGLAIFLPFKVCILLGQNSVPGISDGTVSLNVGIQQTVQIRDISPELFQVAVRLIAGDLAVLLPSAS